VLGREALLISEHFDGLIYKFTHIREFACSYFFGDELFQFRLEQDIHNDTSIP